MYGRGRSGPVRAREGPSRGYSVRGCCPCPRARVRARVRVRSCGRVRVRAGAACQPPGGVTATPREVTSQRATNSVPREVTARRFLSLLTIADTHSLNKGMGKHPPEPYRPAMATLGPLLPFISMVIDPPRQTARGPPFLQSTCNTDRGSA